MASAIIKTGGKQYRVQPGAVLTIEKLVAEEGATVVFTEVLLLADAAGVVPNPGITVSAVIMEQKRGPKIRVFTFKSKKRQRRTMGHRQALTVVKILPFRAAEAAAPAPKGATKVPRAESGEIKP